MNSLISGILAIFGVALAGLVAIIPLILLVILLSLPEIIIALIIIHFVKNNKTANN